MDDEDEGESLLFNLSYCSRGVEKLGPDDIDRLVSAAQRHNARESITGWLVYSHGIFFQWLEGAQADVRRLMASISADPRHDTIVVLSEAEEVRGRVFMGWDMELVSAKDIRAVLFDAIDTATDEKSKGALRLLAEELDSKAVQTRKKGTKLAIAPKPPTKTR